MRNHMEAIPSHIGDVNYVDNWLKREHEVFARKHPMVWKIIKSEVFKTYMLDPISLGPNIIDDDEESQ